MEHSDPIASSISRTPPAPGAASPPGPTPGVAFSAFLAPSGAKPARTPSADVAIASEPKPAKPPRGTRSQDSPAPLSTRGIDETATPADAPTPTVPQLPPPQGGAALAAVPFGNADHATRAGIVAARPKPPSASAVPGQPDDTPEPMEAPGPGVVAAQDAIPPLAPDPLAPPASTQIALPMRDAPSPGGMASPIAGIRATARPQGGLTPAPPSGLEGMPREAGAAPAIPATPSLATRPILERPSAVPSIRLSQPASAVAGQVMPAMLSVVSGAAGPVLTLHLNPGELGAIRVTLERDTGGGAGITLAVERPETLQLLRNDMAHLHAALDMAGVSQAGRTLSLHIQAPDAPPPFLGGNPGQDTSGAPARADGGGADGGHRSEGRHPTGASRHANAPADADTLPDDTPRRATRLRAGIDITA